MSKFKFRTAKKKNKFCFINSNDEILNNEMVSGMRIEMFSNKKMILDGCINIIDYQNSYIKLKLKKANITLFGNDFLICNFENENITVTGNISSIEFCV